MEVQEITTKELNRLFWTNLNSKENDLELVANTLEEQDVDLLYISYNKNDVENSIEDFKDIHPDISFYYITDSGIYLSIIN